MDYDDSREDNRRFSSLKDDRDTIKVPVIASKTIEPARCTAMVLQWPKGNARTKFASDHFVIVCPFFEVSIDDLYELPRCFLPKGTRICSDSLSQVRTYASAPGSFIRICAEERKLRDEEKNRIAALEEEARRLEAENEIKKAEQSRAELEALLLKRAKEAAQQNHEELLKQFNKDLERIKQKIASLKDVLEKGRPKNEDLLHWLECETLLCAALANITAEGPVIYAENSVNVSPEETRRKRLMLFTQNAVEPSGPHEGSPLSRKILREHLGLNAEQCNPLLRLMKLLSRPKIEDFEMSKRAVSNTTADLKSRGSKTASRTR